jgi:S1/P1 Nuclease
VTTYAGQLLAPDAAQAADLTTATWFQESFALARSRVYRAPIRAGLRPYVLTTAYRTGAATTSSRQVSLAGVRLANLINNANLRLRGDPVQQRRCPSA